MTACEKAVIVVSGGMDSAVCASVARESCRELLFLHANYRQRTEEKELACFHALADHFGASERLVIDMGHIAAIGGSSLTDRSQSIETPDLHRTAVPGTYVPFRNANLLAAAVSWAEATKAEAVVIGAVAEDSSGYPDCSQAFIDAFQGAVDAGTAPGTKIRIVAPVIHMTKAEIVRMGVRLKTPLHLTWSCYRAGDIACGDCDSCALRLRGFVEAGVEDPIPYKKRVLTARTV